MAIAITLRKWRPIRSQLNSPNSPPLAAYSFSSSLRGSLLPARLCMASRVARYGGKKLTVLGAEEFGEVGLELLRSHAYVVHYSVNLEPEELRHRVALCEDLIGNSERRWARKSFGRATGGSRWSESPVRHDNVDFAAAKCLVVNALNASMAAVAEQVRGVCGVSKLGCRKLWRFCQGEEDEVGGIDVEVWGTAQHFLPDSLSM